MENNHTYYGKTILVTGGAGAIGSNLTRVLAEEGAEKVIVLDNLSSSVEWNIPNRKNILFVKGDITNENDLRRAFRERPDYIFHAAAFFANQRSVNYPLSDAETNIIGIIKLLEYTALSAVNSKFVYLNTEGGSYGGDSKLPYTEEQQSSWLCSPYYISKHAAELYCNFYFRFHNVCAINVRLFNSYGPGELPGEYRNVIPNFIYWAMKGQPLPLTGSKSMTRDFVFVDDLVKGILQAGLRDDAIGKTINLCTGHETNIYEVAAMINTLTDNLAGIKVMDSRKWDTRSRIAGDNTLARKLLDFKPSTDFETGLRKTIDWFRKHWERIERDRHFNPGMSSAVEKHVQDVY